MAVKDEIAHILHHVEAEAATPQPDQTPGVAERAQLVKDALASFVADSRNLDRRQLLLILIEAIGTPDLRQMVEDISKDDHGDKIRLRLQEWVGRGSQYKDFGD